jgi:hypothetical protein
LEYELKENSAKKTRNETFVIFHPHSKKIMLVNLV